MNRMKLPFAGIMLLIPVCSMQAGTISLMLDPDLQSPPYYYYSYTDTSDSFQWNYVAPYSTSLDGGATYSTVFSVCYDLNNPTYVGQNYSGYLLYNAPVDPSLPMDMTSEEAAYMESSYLINELNIAGMASAPDTLKGEISYAIWQIDFPFSTQTEGSYFPEDPNAQPFIAQAYNAVSSGSWTVADSDMYPTFIPDDSTAQRFGIIFQDLPPIEGNNDPTPEPGALVLLGSGLLAISALFRWQRGHRKARVLGEEQREL
jgi:hypothetical protein